uniref:non-specific serine/threonine protein kinase n=1 Tax=Kalanchoe fedtschenkoi TaxID=63787 RepID=A0A7N0SY13_KALFE
MEEESRRRKPLPTATLLHLLLCWGFMLMTSTAQLIPTAEVATLRAISSKLKVEKYWTGISQSSCSRSQGLNATFGDFISSVTCDCSFSNNTVCHVTNILLKGLNLTGSFPAEFGNLTHLKEIDLSRNYVNGTIPSSLSKLPLVILSLLGNRLSGSIPKEIGDISTLEQLVLEDNQLGGSLDPNLGKLGRLQRLLLSGNNFTGTIPATFGNLRNLTDLRIDGNSLSGRLPDVIGNLKNLTRLDAQGALLSGPIPSTLSQLTNLEQLRISDLSGPSSSVPDFRNLTKLETLVLRNCLLEGTIPDYLGSMKTLKMIDLSFNKLTGGIPNDIQSLNSLDFMFLTNNSLGGEIPGWFISSRENFDVSYNNFTSSPPASCQQSSVNLVSSFSTSNSNSVSWCLRKDLPCPGDANRHSLFINCGGNAVSYDGNEYEEDLTTTGPSHFVSVGTKWAYSSTGVFLGKANSPYRASNFYGFNLSGVYTAARLSPLSLKYYGLCLRKGSYRVRLHFAELMFTDDESFTGLGERIFDIAIQGKLVVKDFNIAKKANGVGKPTYLDFNEVFVNGSTLEIHLYWSGKGTMTIPDRGVYGPLISAITVHPNFDVSTGLSVGAIAGIAAGCVAAVALILVVLWWTGLLCGKKDEDEELRRGLELQTGYFSLRQIKSATDNFNPANKIGEGGFGPVYKGVLLDGKVIAVKQLSAKSKQGNREFVNEIGMISALQHPNLVKLHGCCIEGNQLLLIYEYMENNSLARALFGPPDNRLNLSWSTRSKICLGIAKGLAYLHEESRLKIVHRDIKATNVLLDKDLNAKISDFGLAKLDEEENTHISTRIAGTIGYMAPEYAMRGYLTDKADVYSFGIVALEIVSGKSNTNYRPKEEFVYLLDWAYVLQEQGNLLELVDPSLGTEYNQKEAMRMLNLSLLCTNPSPSLRPAMSSVVKMLEGKAPIQAPVVKRTTFEDDMRFKAFETLSQDSQTHVSAEAAETAVQKTISVNSPWMDSSSSFPSKNHGPLEATSSSKLL